MKKILYVTDLDGTLLNRSDRINPRSIKIINELTEKGMMFTYATARSLVSASVVTKGLSANIPVIAYNGAFIFQPNTGEILSQEKFTAEEMDKVKSVLDRYNISPLVYAFIDGVEKVSWITEKENDGIRRYLSMRKGDKRLNPMAKGEELYQGDAVNDIPMFEISDEAYAVENAVEELKAIATGIIASNENDGVARWLEEHVKGVN